MKKIILTTAIIASVFATQQEAKSQTNNVKTTEVASKSDKGTIDKLVHTYFDALNAGDASKVTALFTKDGVLLAQGAPTASGSDQVNGTFKYVFDNFKYSLQVTIGDINVIGNYAIVSSTSKGSFVITAKGETVPAEYRETFVMQKENGTWKIARYMYNQPK
ncbi:DUF4440 domain-containing protein [Sphingobacteriaceae bacterium]|nr:DUF4440 domain-containing protein [Sphingobacteriaceae bacterium]